MHPRSIFAALALTLSAGAAHAQYYPATYQQPYCREFTKVVNIGGRPQSAYGQACQQPDGSWQIVSDDIPTTQPVQYYPMQNQVTYVPQPTPISVFSFGFSSYNPSRMRYYNDYGHGWRDANRHGYRQHGWQDRGRGRPDGRSRGRGHGRDHGRGPDHRGGRGERH